MTIIMGMLVIYMASTIQGMTSFGFSLIAVPLLGLFMPLGVIVPMMVLYSLLMNFMILMKLRSMPDFKAIGTILITGLIATPAGAYLLKNANPDALKLGVGLVIFISGLFMYKGYKVKFKNKTVSFLVTGFLSGLLNGSISMSGPPVILFMTNEGTPKDKFRTNLTSYFFILNIMTIVIFYFNNQLGTEVLKATGSMLPALIGGVLTGVWLGNHSDEERFRIFTIALIILMGLLSIISSKPLQWFA